METYDITTAAVDQYFFPNVMASTEPTRKRIRFDDELSGSSSTTINERLLKLEEEVVNLHARLDQNEKKRPPRKGTLADLDAKLNTVLDILAKVVTPVCDKD